LQAGLDEVSNLQVCEEVKPEPTLMINTLDRKWVVGRSSLHLIQQAITVFEQIMTLKVWKALSWSTVCHLAIHTANLPYAFACVATNGLGSYNECQLFFEARSSLRNLYRLPLSEAKLMDGDILVIQPRLSEEHQQQLRLPNIEAYLQYVQQRRFVLFKPLVAEDSQGQFVVPYDERHFALILNGKKIHISKHVAPSALNG
jgi:hypothetical protein